jgi:hypothetical protein
MVWTVNLVSFEVYTFLERSTNYIFIVSEIKAIQQWLAPEDRVLAHFAKNTPHLAQDWEEFTCLWLGPYLSRFLKSQQLKGLSISGTPGAGKTVLASVIVDYLQHPFGDITYETVFVSISTSKIWLRLSVFFWLS